MKVIEKSIAELTPYENNPRLNDDAVDGVAESIDRFGFKVPMLIDADGVIVCGHTRYKAAKKLGLDKVPCIIADDLTEDEIKAFRLADNKVAEKAGWDFELLDIELEDIEMDMECFGFDEPIEIGGGNPEAHAEFELAEEKEKANTVECPSCGFVFEVL